MSIEVTIFADASPRAITAFRELPELAGERWLFPYKASPWVATPPMGLLAARDVACRCLDHDASFGDASSQRRFSLQAPPHAGLPPGIWGVQGGTRRGEASWCRRIYPEPDLAALGVLRELAARTAARVWIVCEHERGDDPYDKWAWLFAPARSGRPAYEMVFAYGGDAGRILWQRDLVGPDPWRVFDDEPAGGPEGRLIRHLGLRGSGGLPTSILQYQRDFRL